MEEIGKCILDKISSYNIFNNFFPGFVFCYMTKFLTNYKMDTGSAWENLFIYYFWGLIISRIGSVVIEGILLKIKITNKDSKQKQNYINRASYMEYSRASEKYTFIKILNETNNMYRTMISVFVCVLIIKIYELLSIYCAKILGDIGMALKILFLVVGIILFIMSYKKQTDYIRERVQDYVSEEDKK